VPVIGLKVASFKYSIKEVAPSLSINIFAYRFPAAFVVRFNTYTPPPIAV